MFEVKVCRILSETSEIVSGQESIPRVTPLAFQLFKMSELGK